MVLTGLGTIIQSFQSYGDGFLIFLTGLLIIVVGICVVIISFYLVYVIIDIRDKLAQLVDLQSKQK